MEVQVLSSAYTAAAGERLKAWSSASGGSAVRLCGSAPVEDVVMSCPRYPWTPVTADQSSLVVIAPPSNELKNLVAWKLKTSHSPKLPSAAAEAVVLSVHSRFVLGASPPLWVHCRELSVRDRASRIPLSVICVGVESRF